MKKNQIQKLNDEFNKQFADEVFMPMITFAVTIMFVAIILDYGFQLIEAIDILTQLYYDDQTTFRIRRITNQCR